MFIAELALPDFGTYDLSSLRTGIMAGSPCPVEVMKRVVAEMHMDEVTICYGMTETSPVSTRPAGTTTSSAGCRPWARCMPHVEVKVIDPDTGLTGPARHAGRAVHPRLLRDARLLGRARSSPRRRSTRRGWMHTGDLATMDEEGYVTIVGRIKDMVIRGGENVYPREIEEFLYTHPDIDDVQVIGVPTRSTARSSWPGSGSARTPTSSTIEALRDFCDGKLAHYKVPRYVHLTDEFPMTVTGKVRKFEMRERSVELLGLG